MLHPTGKEALRLESYSFQTRARTGLKKVSGKEMGNHEAEVKAMEFVMRF